MVRQTLNFEEIQIVQQSWNKLEDRQYLIGEAFYHSLFETYPSVKPLFRSDMEKQKRLLIHMINKGVKLLNDIDKLESALSSLGKRHIKYGVKEEHFPCVGETLLKVLKQFLGDEFDEKTLKAWESVYQYWAVFMLDGMK
ncbi:nitric oxide dioxygenase [Galdieria sulphuraria]|uniref:Nitric oxide dioxygenase n=1 Tax=Galdieria sulphuraria TaxID=130081 RepID=M2X487_GALSU|nr:nitric oxide dioxygenase [Galdieria sulphuraria]EME31245.1 nitric oxide dioxygenase [Galdieria sulphuraria]|eukprot:XP_005707765.1 nitric oxide dioxygenase [Galdieria sulphuraria]